MSMPDRRTVGELLADSEALARETLLDATLEQAPAMVRSWNQLVGSAVELWAVLPSAPNSPSWSDPMERLRAIGEAISRSVTAGHWPGQGPTEEHLTQIADNLSHAQHLVERSGRASQSTPRIRRPTSSMLPARSCTPCTWPHTGRLSHSGRTPRIYRDKQKLPSAGGSQ